MPKTTVDRQLHHAHIVMTTGDSIRLTQATTGKGMKPLGRSPQPGLTTRAWAVLLATTGHFY